MSRQILNGWKEISNHLQRGVRTAQRWEALLGMPIHRPALKDRSAVVAFSDELDRWISRTSPDGFEKQDRVVRVHDNLSGLVWQASELASQTRALQEQLRRSLEISRSRTASRASGPESPVSGRNLGAMLPFRAKQPTAPAVTKR